MSASETPSEIQINVKGPSELKLQISITTDKTVLDLKESIARSSDVEANRQRLIYSGRVLKDEDLLSVYKIQSGNTVHMVKGVAKSNNASSSSSETTQPLPTMQAGQNPADPLTQLNGPMAHGLMAGFNPFADLGVNTGDPNMFTGLMDSPQFVEQMSRMMSDPAMLDQMIAMNPQMASMAPQIRQMFSSPHFRQMISNPETLRGMLRMSQMMQNSGASGAGGFPMMPPIGAFGGAAGTANPQGTGQNTSAALPNPFAPAPTQDQGSTPPPGGGNPFGMVDPALLQQMFGGFGGGGGFPGVASPPPPADTRSPEERFQVQLQQLQDMGFTSATQNVRALLATGGNVHAAIEYILNGGGM
ncbi:hypothetical protein SISNIDRAFT_485732 [Sistotremastrum niveocremeum HHB9708]|uniref:Ubiquitin-domain-containing protein n=1 Tax=Sistotremastrum niveocremeum HHB9708 TaxID=1314777 RepID=A0A164US49_9AGAM|nr:hypothetical protein SISNIDRAFT_485732 [Sistotremastrum niveocremeum HHB9708]